MNRAMRCATNYGVSSDRRGSVVGHPAFSTVEFLLFRCVGVQGLHPRAS